LGEAAEGYLTPIIVIIVLVSVLPMGIHVLRDVMTERRARKAAQVATAESDPSA
jgi:hypothetical protein